MPFFVGGDCNELSRLELGAWLPYFLRGSDTDYFCGLYKPCAPWACSLAVALARSFVEVFRDGETFSSRLVVFAQ